MKRLGLNGCFERFLFRGLRSESCLRRPAIFIVATFLMCAYALPAGALTLTVNDLGDLNDTGADGVCLTSAGTCTLRAAIREVNWSGGADNTINFNPSLSGTILLSSGFDIITKPLAINGPGSDRVSIDAQNLYRIFYIDTPADNGSFVISDLRLMRGIQTNGGAVYADTGDSLSLTRMVFEGNNASTAGGAVNCNHCGSLSIAYSRFTKNIAIYLGGGVFAEGATINVADSLFEGNAGSANFNGGGGMTVLLGTGSITDSLFENNQAAMSGGGLYFDGIDNGTLTIRDSRFVRNNAGGLGGGIYLGNAGSSVINRITVSGNTATSGGGIIVDDQSASIANSTVSRNSALYAAGGIYGGGDSTVQLSNVTITGNTADSSKSGSGDALGGGVYSYATLIVQNSVIAGNVSLNPSYVSGADCYSVDSVSSGGYNVIGDGTGCVFAGGTGDQVGAAGSLINPLLASLAWNGGTTTTHALLSGSPAIDSGNPGGCFWDNDADGGTTTAEVLLVEDQRGAIRPFGGRCDVGAFEWSHCDNGIQDSDETGIDCGGSDCAVCSCGGTDPAKMKDTGYADIQLAYNAAWDSATVKSRATDTSEDLVFNRAMHFTLKGGHDCDFFRIRGMTTVASLTVSAGQLTVEDVAIGP